VNGKDESAPSPGAQFLQGGKQLRRISQQLLLHRPRRERLNQVRQHAKGSAAPADLEIAQAVPLDGQRCSRFLSAEQGTGHGSTSPRVRGAACRNAAAPHTSIA